MPGAASAAVPLPDAGSPAQIAAPDAGSPAQIAVPDAGSPAQIPDAASAAEPGAAAASAANAREAARRLVEDDEARKAADRRRAMRRIEELEKEVSELRFQQIVRILAVEIHPSAMCRCLSDRDPGTQDSMPVSQPRPREILGESGEGQQIDSDTEYQAHTTDNLAHLVLLCKRRNCVCSCSFDHVLHEGFMLAWYGTGMRCRSIVRCVCLGHFVEFRDIQGAFAWGRDAERGRGLAVFGHGAFHWSDFHRLAG
jgi:hypothetical protein